MSDAPELKPCPLCGGTDIRDESYWIASPVEYFGRYACSNCDTEGPTSEFKYDNRADAQSDAAAQWNTRADTITTPSWHRIDDPDNPPPMDGTKILAYDGIGTFTVEWHSCGWMGSEVDGDPFPSDDLPITHWMPLPTPPKGPTHD